MCPGAPAVGGRAREQNQACSLQARALEKGWSWLQPLGLTCPLCLPQGQRFHHYGAPASGTREKDGFPRPLRTLGPPRFRPTADGAQSSSRKAGPAMASPQHWQAKSGPGPRMLPGPGSPRPARNASALANSRATEEHPSPFGIPYSKLSQSKHLKARAGGSQWAPSDSKRRAHAPRDHKDP